jgi:conjugative relaxase-like TrwC/TraI family protein
MTSELLNDLDAEKPWDFSEDYYIQEGKEPPGKWYFAPSYTQVPSSSNSIFERVDPEISPAGIRGNEFGLVHGGSFSTRDVDTFGAICDGLDPVTGDKLVQIVGEKRIALHDFTFSPPKSFSVIWSQAELDLKEEIENFQQESCCIAMDLLSEKSAFSRMGKDGYRKVRTSFVGATFEHGSSRADDPQLHTHSAILNFCRRSDGTTGAVEIIKAMRWQGAIASMYHANMAYRMREKGFAIILKGNIPEIDGVPRAVIEGFSQRRKQLEKAVEGYQIEHGIAPDITRASRELIQVATKETRDGKNEKSRSELEEAWLLRGRAMGFSKVQVREVMHLGEPIHRMTKEELLKEAREAIEKLTETDALFHEPTLYVAITTKLTGRASQADIKLAVEMIRSELVYTDIFEPIRGKERGESVRVFSTREMLMMERELLFMASSKNPQNVMSAKVVEDFIRDQSAEIKETVEKNIKANGINPLDAFGLQEDQKAAIRSVLLSECQVQIIEGTVGPGKSYTAASIALAWKLNGPSHQVHGLNADWAMALNLKSDAKLDSGHAIEGWLADIADGKFLLNAKSLILLDDAGVVGVRDMRNVIKAVHHAGAKIILLGNTLLQASASAGDALRVLAKEHGAVRLDKVRRQINESHRLAVYELYAGRADVALDLYKDRITICEDNDSTNKAIVDMWAKSRFQNPEKSHLILALDSKSVHHINALAHKTLKALGLLGNDSVNLFTRGGEGREEGITVKDNYIEFSVGDEVVFRNSANSRSPAVDQESRKVAVDFNAAIKRFSEIQHDIHIIHCKPNGQEKNESLDSMNKAFVSHFRDSETYFCASQNEYSQEIGARMKIQRELMDIHEVKSMRTHLNDIHERIDAADRERSTHIDKPIRGIIEKINVDSKIFTIRIEDGKFIEYDQNDKNWQIKMKGRSADGESGLAIQHAYACSIFASQGLNRDKVFGKDSPTISREQAGVIVSCHKEDYFHFVDRKARYAYSTRLLSNKVEIEMPITKFTNEECIKQMKATYTRQRGKISTLDFRVWKDGAGKEIYPEVEFVWSTIDEVRSLLLEAEYKILSNGTAEIPCDVIDECPFQLDDRYVLPEPIFNNPIIQSNAQNNATERLCNDGIHSKVIAEAQAQGFTTFFEDGYIAFNGRRPSDGKVVNRIRDGALAPGIFRDRYPPVLMGNPKEVHIVTSGEDALALWSILHENEQDVPTVIVVQGSLQGVMCLKHVRDLLTECEISPVIHFDIRVSLKVREEYLRYLSAISQKTAIESDEKHSLTEQARDLESARQQTEEFELEHSEEHQRPALGG